VDGGDEAGAVDCHPIYANESSTAPSPDGETWSTAYRDLQAALTKAESRLGVNKCAQVEVWVAQGTYTPGPSASRDASFVLKDGLAIYGGFAGTETTREQRDSTKYISILSGDLARDDAVTGGSMKENAYHVVRSQFTSASAVLDGVVLEAGYADGPFPDYDGGAIYLKSSGAHFSNVTARNSWAVQDGGGIYVDQGTPTFELVTVSNCTAARGGGFFHHSAKPVLKTVTVTGCYANGGTGGGIFNDSSDAQILDSTVNQNESASTSEAHGGALYNANSAPLVQHTTFDDNSAVHQGGGTGSIYTPDSGGAIYNSQSSPKIVDCQFARNVVIGDAEAFGGTIFDANGSKSVIVRSGFDNNRAVTVDESVPTTAYGGAIASENSTTSVYNCTFTNGQAYTGGGGVYAATSTVLVVNSVFSQTTAGGAVYIKSGTATFVNDYFSNNGGSAINGPATLVNSVVNEFTGPPLSNLLSVQYSCVIGANYGATMPPGTNRDDCLLNGDHLAAGSTAIDRGDTSALPPDVGDLDGDGNVTEAIPLDLDGKKRVVGTAVDMGPYEYQ
jgi:hypothetical protein